MHSPEKALLRFYILHFKLFNTQYDILFEVYVSALEFRPKGISGINISVNKVFQAIRYFRQ